MRVKIRGVVYETERAAAAAFGVTVAYLNQMLDAGKEDKIGLGRGTGRSQPAPFRIEGLVFKNMRAASIALGFRPNRIAEIKSLGRTSAMAKVIEAAKAYKEKNP